MQGGNDRLSGAATQTFTQNDTFHNCLSCHNTSSINAYGVSAAPGCLVANPPSTCSVTLVSRPAAINVSHVFAEFIRREEAPPLPSPGDAGFGGD
jgi:hypothetical protein